MCGVPLQTIPLSVRNLSQINSLKKFDESLRLFLLKYITQVEEEARTLTGYKFDQCNDNGKIPWYETSAYSLVNRFTLGKLLLSYIEYNLQIA